MPPIIVDLSGNRINFAFDLSSFEDKNSTSRWQVVVLPDLSHPSNTMRAPRPQPVDIFLKSMFKILQKYVAKSRELNERRFETAQTENRSFQRMLS